MLKYSQDPFSFNEEKFSTKEIQMKKTCLISTVGTSLLFNLKTIKSEQYPNKTEEEIIVMYKDNQLNGRKPSAELASISSIIESNKLDETNKLYLLSSDTDDGYRAATFIKEYF